MTCLPHVIRSERTIDVDGMRTFPGRNSEDQGSHSGECADGSTRSPVHHTGDWAFVGSAALAKTVTQSDRVWSWGPNIRKALMPRERSLVCSVAAYVGHSGRVDAYDSTPQTFSHAEPCAISDCPLDDWLCALRERLQFAQRCTFPVDWSHDHRDDKNAAFSVLFQSMLHFNAVAII